MRRSINMVGVKFMCLVWLLSSSEAHAQKLWSEVKLNHTSVYVGEPVEVSITVYTSTWFTSGIDPGNIKVNGAFTIYFRPVSVSVMKDGQNFPGVELIYHVFPFDEKDIVFPSLTLEVESPPDGDYKGVKHTLNTHPRNIRVKPIPPDFDKRQWLVATNLSVTDHWVGDLKNVKVGDVLERRISRTASNTVSELIPPVVWDSLANVSLYPTRSSVENHKSSTSISASRIESIRYLFEKEGTVTIPEIVFHWYNPYQKKLYKRTLTKVTIDVQPNPDLRVLASIRDSLRAEQIQDETMAEGKEKSFTILGLSPKIFFSALVVGIGGIYLLIILLTKLIHWANQRRQRYRISEAFFFHQLINAVRKKSSHEIFPALYRWIDQLNLAEPSIRYFIQTYADPTLLSKLGANGNKINEKHIIHLIQIRDWRNMREKYNHPAKITSAGSWINPLTSS